MVNPIKKPLFVLIFLVSTLMMSTAVVAQDWPLKGGDFWEVTAIDIKDGAGLKYSSWLATEWRKNLEFSKSKGWIKDFKILANVHARKGEASLYLVRVMESVPDAAEGEKRLAAWIEFQKKSVEKMQEESGNRAEYREVMSDSLLQELHFRD